MKNQEQRKEIVERILKMASKSGKMDKEIINATGLSQTALSEWRNGRAYPSTNAIIKLAEYFNVSTDYLLNGKEFEITDVAGLDPEWRKIIEKIAAMPDNEKKECTAYIKGFIEGYTVK